MLRRRKSNDEDPEEPEKHENENENEKDSKEPKASVASHVPRWKRYLHLASFILHFASCIFFVIGFHFCRNRLYTSEECDMTYSMRQFLPLQIETATPYKLFKFVDMRDPRHRRFLSTDEPLTGSDWCLDANSTTAVLYIPGNAGSYQQSRSLGAHGIQLTASRDASQQRKVLSALHNGQWVGDALNLDDFVYDVYAVDLLEEAGGLHGDFLIRQSQFIAESVMHLVQNCGLHRVLPVAHSIGGYSTRLAVVEHPEIRPYVTDIVTLGTPHARTILAWDRSIHRVHQKVISENQTVLISISGGLRDEMIPPSACHVERANALAVSAVDVMKAGVDVNTKMPALGMDHRAIVWCRNLLLSVRSIIYTLSQAQRQGQGSADRVMAVRRLFELDDSYSYATSTQRLRENLRVSHDKHLFT